jgi:glutaredoxin
MRKAFLLIIILVLTAFGSTITVAAPATTIDAGIVFGGQWFEANESGASVVNLSEMAPIVEVYTATWCSNCVDVEHALENIENVTGLQQYHIHRAINEAQDPLGSIDLDQRFYDRYGVFAPPVVVVNGSMIKLGSVTDEDSLESEFTDLIQLNSLDIAGISSFTWNSTSNNTGTATWTLESQNLPLPDAGSLSAYAWIVEHSANFEEGTNGLGDYPHVVRGIIELGEIDLASTTVVASGSSNITLPAAYDGNDLAVHLIYQFNPPAEGEEPEQESPPLIDSPKEGLPAASLLASICVVFGAALIRRD